MVSLKSYLIAAPISAALFYLAGAATAREWAFLTLFKPLELAAFVGSCLMLAVTLAMLVEEILQPKKGTAHE